MSVSEYGCIYCDSVEIFTLDDENSFKRGVIENKIFFLAIIVTFLSSVFFYSIVNNMILTT